MNALSTLCLLLCGLASAHNGYVASFTTPGQMASTGVARWDPSQPEMARLASSFTMMAWIRFSDLSSRQQFVISVIRSSDVNYFQPFAGQGDGFVFGSAGPAVVSVLGAAASDWHHYTFSWRSSDGDVSTYVDGVPVGTDTLGTGASLIDQETTLVLGMNCVPSFSAVSPTYTACNRKLNFFGDLDDVAFFAGKMTDAEVALRWNTSLIHPAATGSEPNLVLLWDFDDPLSSEGKIPNRGSAGGDYNLTLGFHATDACPGIMGHKYKDMNEGQVYEFLAPSIVPGGTDTATQIPRAHNDDAPLVISADAGETISVSAHGSSFVYTAPTPFGATQTLTATGGDGASMAVHVMPRVTPQVPSPSDLVFTVLEDGALWMRPTGRSTLDRAATVRITMLPFSGTLYDAVSDRATASTVINTANQSIVGPYVKYVPNLDFAGQDKFEYTWSVDDYALTSEPAMVTLNVEGDNDVPQVSSVSAHELVEDELSLIHI
eukprot:1389651-Prymnesium_polylepis.1